MNGLMPHLGWVAGWATAVAALAPVLIITACVALVTLWGLFTRSPARRRHSLELLRLLTQFVAALRNPR